MKLSEVANLLEAEVNCCKEEMDREVNWCYCSDLLSDVMANAGKDNIWITLQTHPNIVAVASLLNLSAILISRGCAPDPETLDKAAQEKIPVLTTALPTFEAAGKLYSMLPRSL